MKLTVTLSTLALALSTSAFATPPVLTLPTTPAQPVPLAEQVIIHSAVQSTFALLNAANNNLCTAPTSSDVQVYCMGALVPVKSATIINTGCAFSLQMNCSNGAGATISGQGLSLQIQNVSGKMTGAREMGIQIDNIDLTPAMTIQ